MKKKKEEKQPVQKNIRLIISKELSHTVSYLHSVVGKVEWSGILVYSVEEGNINDPGSLVLKAQDLYVMDVGSSAFTEYDFGTVITDVHKKFPKTDPFELSEEQIANGEVPWKIGHIHTHHGMETFFSNTDEKELDDNAPHHSYYLSLIANFKSDYTAKVAINGNTKEISRFSWRDGSGENVSVESVNEVNQVFAFDCDILFEELASVQDQIKEIGEKKKKEKSKFKPKGHAHNVGKPFFNSSDHILFPSKNGRQMDISPNQQSLVQPGEFTDVRMLEGFLVSIICTGSQNQSLNIEDAFRFADSGSEEELEMWEEMVIDSVDGSFYDYFPNTSMDLKDVAEKCCGVVEGYINDFKSADILHSIFVDLAYGD